MGFLIDWMLPAALAIMMFSLGLSLTMADFARIAQFPKAFAVGAFAQMILLPISAFFVGWLFGLPPEFALGMVVLALCPGGPTSNYFTKLARGDVALSVSLTAAITVISVFSMPVLASYAGVYFLGDSGRPVSVFPIAIRSILSMLVPITLGIWMKRIAPNWVAKIDRPVSTVAVLLIAIVIFGSLANQWSNFTTWFSTLALLCFTMLIAMLSAGLLLGKLFALQQSEISSISIDTAMQNAVMGITIGSMFPATSGSISLVSIPSGMYGLMMYFVCIPFVFWRRGQAVLA